RVVAALRKVDNNILKLDSAVESTMRAIDRPAYSGFTVERVVDLLCQFSGECIVQTMMLRGTHCGTAIDNTTDAEIDALIEAYRKINPREVMLYSLDRPTPESNLQRVERDELEAIADRMRRAGIKIQVN
ncbi:MAG: radical SAM protein, partial [Bacteroidales bacterium]|nr:radical SAM protein [Bacteroidales bacterium]